MKKVLRIFLCFAFLLLAVAAIGTTSVSAASKMKNNKKVSVSVKAGATKKYSIKVSEYSHYSLTTTASYDDRMNISIKLTDKAGKEIITDSGKWSSNKSDSKLYDMTMETYLVPGTYYLTFKLDSGSPKWTHTVVSKISKFKALKNSKKTSVTLAVGETKYYKVTAAKSGHFLFTTASKSSYDIDFYLLDKNGVELDDDDTNPDWTFDEAAGKKSMNWHTVDITKGTYYLKIVNRTGSKQTIKVGAYLKTDDVKTSYAWVLVDTQIDVEDDYRRDDGMYVDHYKATENEHIHEAEAHYDKNDNRYGTTIGTCQTPPSIIHQKEKVGLHITLDFSGTTGGDSIHVRPEFPDVSYGANTGYTKFATENGDQNFWAGINDDSNHYDEVVYGTLPDGEPGKQFAIFFNGCGANTKWIYEYKLVD